jgi:hypothetical protein
MTKTGNMFEKYRKFEFLKLFRISDFVLRISPCDNSKRTVKSNLNLINFFWDVIRGGPYAFR